MTANSVAEIARTMAIATHALANTDGLDIAQTRDAIQARMSDYAGFLCEIAEVPRAYAEAQALRTDVLQRGFSCTRPAQLIEVFRWRHLVLASEAVLAALNYYINQGGGSRGARAYLSKDGTQVPDSQRGVLEDYRFREERTADREYKLVLRWLGDGFSIEQRALRQMEDLGRIFFEKNWSFYLTGSVYQKNFQHR